MAKVITSLGHQRT